LVELTGVWDRIAGGPPSKIPGSREARRIVGRKST